MRAFLIMCFLLMIQGAFAQYENLKEGDLLFQDLDCGQLCDAIESVTEGVNGKDFSHCGMVVIIDERVWVLEAIGKEVQLTLIKDFFRRSGDSIEVQNIIHMRVKPAYQKVVDNALMVVNNYIGMPYDDVFLMDNGAYYCSELIYELFRDGNEGEPFFHLEPMTYKVPGKEVFFPAWIDYFDQFEVPIPEGKPGINPGLISRSEKLLMIHP